MLRLGIVPARLASTRFPEKVIQDIDGIPMICHTLKQVEKCKKLDRIFVAIDSEKTRKAINSCATGAGAKILMTSDDHATGTDRISEVVDIVDDCFGIDDNDIVINIQGDEPMIDPNCIDALVEEMEDGCDLATIASTELTRSHLYDENVVKVIKNKEHEVVDFVRKVTGEGVPNYLDSKEGYEIFKHIGLYAYTKKSLNRFVSLPQSDNEKERSLEQLRALDNGFKINAFVSSYSSLSVDTVDDFILAKSLIEGEKGP